MAKRLSRSQTKRTTRLTSTQIVEDLGIPRFSHLPDDVLNPRNGTPDQLMLDLILGLHREVPPVFGLGPGRAQSLVLRDGEHDDLWLAPALDDHGCLLLYHPSHYLAEVNPRFRRAQCLDRRAAPCRFIDPWIDRNVRWRRGAARFVNG